MADTAEQAHWPDGRPPNAQGDEVLTMQPPLDLAQERADAEVEATAFQNSIDQLVSRYEVLMENIFEPEPDPEADSKEELSRLRSLGDQLNPPVRTALSRRKTTSDAHKLYKSAVKTGADLSVYNRNPFYQNSSVKLPIRPNECVPAGTDKYPAPPPLNFKGITDSPFTWDIRSYPSWRDAFIRIVHAPGRVMQDSERLLYLKQCLKGQPLDLINRYPITDMGYQFATEMLEDTFFDEEKSRFTLRQDLQAVRPPGTGYTDLLRFQQDVHHNCGNFYEAGEDIARNDWCSDIVMSKLPYSVRHTLNQRKEAQRDESPWTIAQLLEELHCALKLVKQSALYDGGPSRPAGSKSNNNRFQAQEGAHASSAERTGGTFFGAITKDPKSRSCAFCGVKGSHWPTDCPNYPTVSSRYERLKELNFCFVCLGPDHWRNNAKACRAVNSGACSSCHKAFHHKALCPVFLEKRRAGGSRQQDRNKKSSNRYQRGAGPIQDPKNGRQPYRGQYGGGVPVAPGGTALHPTSYAPKERQSHPGRAQTHAAAAVDFEEAGATYMAEHRRATMTNIGIEKNDPRKEDAVVHERIKKSICLADDDEGRYQVRLPWKTKDGEPPSNQELPTHLGLARGRLNSFQRANAHQPDFLQKYGEGFDQMEADGVIEKFNIRDKNISFLHFLAHHAVVKESSATTKVRSVFDGSAHLPGMPSINDYLHRGPVPLPTMAGILLRTRVHSVVIIADIAKAFLQVSLHPTDRSACAFLWLKDPMKPPDDDNLIFYRFRRMTFGLKPSPFLLGAVI